MVIAVNILPCERYYKNFLQKAVLEMARAQPGTHIYLLDDQPAADYFPSNVSVQLVKAPAKNLVSRKWWYGITLPRILKKLRADVFLAADGSCAFRTSLPQCLLVPHLIPITDPSANKQHFFEKRHRLRSFQKAKLIGTFSTAMKETIAGNGIPAEKIKVLPPAVSPVYHRLDAPEATAVMEKYTGGAAYFICSYPLPLAAARHLLKAFSLFKKRQKSSMNLVLYEQDGLKQLLTHYRYRQDVVLYSGLEETESVALLAAAYASIDPLPSDAPWGLSLRAMQCGVPVLSAGKQPESDVLVFDPDDHNSIAEQLMLVYKDEPLRNRLVESGLSLTVQLRFENTATALWELLPQAFE